MAFGRSAAGAGGGGGVGFGASALGAALAGSGVEELTLVERGRGVVVDEFEFCAFT